MRTRKKPRMAKADYGIYGSLTSYVALAVIASISLVLIIFENFLRAVFSMTLAISAVVLVALLLVQVVYSRRRIGLVPEIIKAGSICSGNRVLDIGTGRVSRQ